MVSTMFLQTKHRRLGQMSKEQQKEDSRFAAAGEKGIPIRVIVQIVHHNILSVLPAFLVHS